MYVYVTNGYVKWNKNYKDSNMNLRRTYTKESLRATLKKYEIGKHLAIVAYIDLVKKIMFIHKRLALELSRCREEFPNGWL